MSVSETRIVYQKLEFSEQMLSSKMTETTSIGLANMLEFGHPKYSFFILVSNPRNCHLRNRSHWTDFE